MTGRNAKIHAWTSVDTGRTLHVRKVSTLLRAEIRRQVLLLPAFAEPEPPWSDVEYGDGSIRVANRSHPIYRQLLTEWNQRVTDAVATRLKDAAIERGVIVDSTDIDQEAVAEVRTQCTGLESYSDRYVYIAFVCVGSEDDWTDLLAAIFQRSTPQEAVIESHIATFQPDVQGAAAVS